MMKKMTAILLTLALLLSLTACGDVLSKLKPEAGPPETVQPKEPDIPNTAPPTGDESNEPVEPVQSQQPEPDAEPAAGEEDGEAPDWNVTASHEDVTLFSAGETFTLSARGIEGVYASTFASKDPEVAEVDETTGVVTAAAPGMTTVTMHVECEAGQFDFDCIVRCRWEAEEPDLPGGGPDQEPAQQPDAPAQEPGGSSQTSLSGFFSTLQGKYEGLGMMMVMDEQLLDAYYPGLTDIAAVEEVLVQETAISMANIAVGLVRLSDSATMEDVLAVQNVFQSRITAQAEGGALYPASCETWENGVITSVSNCVGMFVYPDDAHAMANLFTDTFGN